MGKRTRRQGITNAAVRAAHRVLGEKEARATALAGDIYNVAMEQLDTDVPDPLPLEARVPLNYLGAHCAPYMLGRAKLEPTPENVADVIAYLAECFLSIYVEFDPEHFEKWRKTSDELAGMLGICVHCGKPGVEHAERDGMRWCDDGTLAALPELKLKDEEPEPPDEPVGDDEPFTRP
jgi:hypothetical protein